MSTMMKTKVGISLVIHRLMLRLPLQRVQVRSLIRELAAKKPNHKTSNIVNKFNNDFKNGPHPKKKKNLEGKSRSSTEGKECWGELLLHLNRDGD